MSIVATVAQLSYWLLLDYTPCRHTSLYLQYVHSLYQCSVGFVA